MSDFFSSFVKSIKQKDLSIVSDGQSSAEFSGFLDTGCYLLNAGISGSIFGGIPNNKILAIAGAESTGKSFLMLNIIKHFLSQDKMSGVFYFDTESAITQSMMSDRGIDTDRVVLSEPNTIQEFRNTALKILDHYEEQDERPPAIMVLDSMGQLSSTKELEDTAEEKETVDMTKAKVLKATFRVLGGRLAKLGIPLLITNHTYALINAYIPEEEMCLVEGTEIVTAEGFEKIENFEVGDEIIGVFGSEKITEIHEYDAKDIYELEFEDGSVIQATENHRFLVDGKWVCVSDLEGMVKNTKNINISDVHKGDINVFRQQIYENLSSTDGTGEK